MIVWLLTATVASLPHPETQAAALFHAAESRYQQSDARGALVLFQASYRLVPAAALWVDIAQCLRQLGRKQESAEAYRHFLESRSGDRHLRAEVFEALDELEAAPRAPVEANPNARARSAALFQRARARYQAGDFAAALEGFRAAAAELPLPELQVNVAQCLRQLDRPEDAVLAYHAFLASSPGPRQVRIEVWEALDETLGELDQRLYRLAESAALLERLASEGGVDPLRRQAATLTARQIRQSLVEIDARLSPLFR